MYHDVGILQDFFADEGVTPLEAIPLGCGCGN